jgi:hypothetical protein
MAAVGRVCEICRQPEKTKRNGKRRELCADHDDKAKKFRGVLCRKHNLTIKDLGDSSEMAMEAVHYLIRTSSPLAHWSQASLRKLVARGEEAKTYLTDDCLPREAA